MAFHSNCCGALIISQRGDTCLLVRQRDTKKWGLPKGSRNLDENPKEGMVREVLEETGLDLDRCRHRVVGWHRRQKYMIFVIRLQQPHQHIRICPRDSNEIDCAQWLKWNDVPGLLMNHITRVTLFELGWKHYGSKATTLQTSNKISGPSDQPGWSSRLEDSSLEKSRGNNNRLASFRSIPSLVKVSPINSAQ